MVIELVSLAVKLVDKVVANLGGGLLLDLELIDVNRPGIRGGWLGQVVSSSRQMPR